MTEEEKRKILNEDEVKVKITYLICGAAVVQYGLKVSVSSKERKCISCNYWGKC